MDGNARAGCGGETIILVTGQWKVGLSVFFIDFRRSCTPRRQCASLFDASEILFMQDCRSHCATFTCRWCTIFHHLVPLTLHGNFILYAGRRVREGQSGREGDREISGCSSYEPRYLLPHHHPYTSIVQVRHIPSTLVCCILIAFSQPLKRCWVDGHLLLF